MPTETPAEHYEPPRITFHLVPDRDVPAEDLEFLADIDADVRAAQARHAAAT